MPEAVGTGTRTWPLVNLAVAFLLPVLAFVACSRELPNQELLPSLGTSDIITVSGLSSGGYMAGQYQVAFSKHVSGAGMAAAGPWGCANGDINRALRNCISGEGLDASELHERVRATAAAGGIDATANLKDDRLFLFRGSNDAVISARIADELQSWFAHYVDPANTRYVADVPAVHGWPTAEFGSDCDTFAAPYINNCGYDLAGQVLSHLYPDLKLPLIAARTVRRFDQRPFADAELAEFGYVYIPEACESTAGCRLHVFFHGCQQSASTIGTDLVDNAGFNRWAEANDIVVLYPQVEPSVAAPMNPLGCWDWWGYTGPNYLEQSAPQLTAVRQMVATLAKPPR